MMESTGACTGARNAITSDADNASIISTLTSMNVSQTAAGRASRSSTRMRCRAAFPDSRSSWYTGRCSERARSKRRQRSAGMSPVRHAIRGSDASNALTRTGSPKSVPASVSSTTRSKKGFSHHSANQPQTGAS